MSEFLSRSEAAEYVTGKGLPLKRGTLGKWATIGGGPAFRKFGCRAVYRREDLDAWIQEKLSAPRKSTSAPA